MNRFFHPSALGDVNLNNKLYIILVVHFAILARPELFIYNLAQIGSGIKQTIFNIKCLTVCGICFVCTAKTQYQKFETNIPRKGIARPQSQFPHSCVCERFIYFHNRSAYSAAGKYVDRLWEYINRSQTHECGNWDWGCAIPFLGTHKWDFCCSVVITWIYRKTDWWLRL